MTAAIWEQVRPRYGYQRVLYILGVAMLASAAIHLVVFALDGSAWWGPVSWRKPINFAFSLGVTALSIGWAQGLMGRSRVLGWTTTALIGGASVIELGLITMQTWRGVPSHFNVATDFDGAVFTAMGVSVGTLTLGLLVMAAWAGFRLRGRPSALIAVSTGLGLLLSRRPSGPTSSVAGWRLWKPPEPFRLDCSSALQGRESWLTPLGSTGSRYSSRSSCSSG